MRLKNGFCVKFFALFLVFGCVATASAQSTWQEGEHYEVISDKASETKQVREVFSFWCPSCFNFEAVAKQIKSSIADDTKFIKAHVNFLGSSTAQAQNDATIGMLAARAMKQEELYNAALFNAIHKDRKDIAGLDDILAVFSAEGGDSEKLEKLASSFGIRGQVAKNDKLTRGVRSVPSFIVNDKYKAKFGRDMSPDQFVELIMWLTTQK